MSEGSRSRGIASKENSHFNNEMFLHAVSPSVHNSPLGLMATTTTVLHSADLSAIIYWLFRSVTILRLLKVTQVLFDFCGTYVYFFSFVFALLLHPLQGRGVSGVKRLTQSYVFFKAEFQTKLCNSTNPMLTLGHTESFSVQYLWRYDIWMHS